LLIGLYLHGASASAAYSIAGGMIVVQLWIYYSAQVFLPGAEFTKISATRRGRRQGAGKTLAPLTLDNRGNRRLRGA
jgi:membrane protein